MEVATVQVDSKEIYASPRRYQQDLHESSLPSSSGCLPIHNAAFPRPISVSPFIALPVLRHGRDPYQRLRDFEPRRRTMVPSSRRNETEMGTTSVGTFHYIAEMRRPTSCRALKNRRLVALLENSML